MCNERKQELINNGNKTLIKALMLLLSFLSIGGLILAVVYDDKTNDFSASIFCAVMAIGNFILHYVINEFIKIDVNKMYDEYIDMGQTDTRVSLFDYIFKETILFVGLIFFAFEFDGFQSGENGLAWHFINHPINGFKLLPLIVAAIVLVITLVVIIWRFINGLMLFIAGFNPQHLLKLKKKHLDKTVPVTLLDAIVMLKLTKRGD